VVGGAIVANEFRRLGLIDEYCLFVHPVVVGQGRRPFEPSDQPKKLRLTETKSFGNGVVFLRYAA
jgi:riboflavin biosynthesis pyrimidine reductase